MKRSLLLVIGSICIQFISLAQSDSAIIYCSDYEETTMNNADTYIIFYKKDNLWHGKKYNIKSGILLSEGKYLEKNPAKQTGTFNYYSDKGTLKSVAVYNDTSKKMEHTYFMKMAVNSRT
ncbi:MAG TPA: hypothetical protein VF622_01955 [Segetibacter sp.]|jgi:hypothetical protein